VTTTWTPDELDRIGDAEELDLASRRPDGSLRAHVTMWVVRAGDDVYVRSAYGPQNPWYVRATASGTGREDQHVPEHAGPGRVTGRRVVAAGQDPGARPRPLPCPSQGGRVGYRRRAPASYGAAVPHGHEPDARPSAPVGRRRSQRRGGHNHPSRWIADHQISKPRCGVVSGGSPIVTSVPTTL
jgi:hypothetical protein